MSIVSSENFSPIAHEFAMVVADEVRDNYAELYPAGRTPARWRAIQRLYQQLLTACDDDYAKGEKVLCETMDEVHRVWSISASEDPVSELTLKLTVAQSILLLLLNDVFFAKRASETIH